MTKEEAKKRLPIIQAFAEEKPIQAMYLKDGYSAKYVDWFASDPLDFENYDYRIKPEPKFHPYKQDEFLEATKKHGSFVYLLNNRGFLSESCYNINYCDATAVRAGDSFYMYDEFLEKFVWADDKTPCGIVEE